MKRRLPNLPLGVVIMTLAVLILPGPLHGQLFGTHLVQTSSGHPELPSPGGYGAFALIPLSSWMDLRLSYDHITQDSKGPGEVCGHYAPNLMCRPEPVETSTSLGNLGFALLPTIQVRDVFRVSVGPGFGMTQISARSIGTLSGRRANFETPKTAQLGYSGLLSISATPTRLVPLTVVGTAAAHWIEFKGCVSYEEVYAPFCGKNRITELGLGLAFRF